MEEEEEELIEIDEDEDEESFSSRQPLPSEWKGEDVEEGQA